MRFIASLRGGLHLRLKAVSSHPLRCFLTRRIDFFRAAALLLANTRKSERLDVQAHPSNTLPQRRPKMVFSPLYGTFRPHFSSEKWPWIEISIPWIGESMGWKWISMGCFGRGGFPWDVSAEGPHGRAEISLKGGRRWASVLTVCHIAHRASQRCRRPRRGRKKGVPRFATEHPFTEFI